MGILYKLNQLTQSMNETADRSTGSQNQQFQYNQTIDTSSFGNVNTDNANRSITSQDRFLQKSDRNIKILDTTIYNFLDSQSYSQYLQNFLSSLPNFSILPVDYKIKQQINYKNIFYAQIEYNMNFLIMCSTEYAEAQNLIKTLIKSNNMINNVSKVLIGYFEYDQLALTNAKNNGIEIIGISEFTEINSYATSNTIPDLNFVSQQNSFKASLGRALRAYNTYIKNNNEIKTGTDRFTQSLEDRVRLLVAQQASI